MYRTYSFLNIHVIFFCLYLPFYSDWHCWTHRSRKIQSDQLPLPDNRSCWRQYPNWWHRYLQNWLTWPQGQTHNHTTGTADALNTSVSLQTVLLSIWPPPAGSGAVLWFPSHEPGSIWQVQWWRYLESVGALPSEGVCVRAAGRFTAWSRRRRRKPQVCHKIAFSRNTIF